MAQIDTLAEPRTTPTPLTGFPTPPARGFSFTDDQVNNPTSKTPGDRLDAEFDRSNAAVAGVITATETSLNPDGTLKSATVGSAQLVPGLFDFIANDAISQVQPLVDQAQGYSSAAQASATAADTSATNAQTQATAAAGSASTASSASALAGTSQTAAASSASQAAASASLAANENNDAQEQATQADLARQLAQGWAEHMPDTIPPALLAAFAITGDHWSSRWWANQAAIAAGQAIGFQTYYLGAAASPPASNPATGLPPIVGALYFDTVLQEMRVCTGPGTWASFASPSGGSTARYQYIATTNAQASISGPDALGNPLVMNPSTDAITVYHQGDLLKPTRDYALAGPTSPQVSFNNPFRGTILAGDSFDVIVVRPLSSTAYTSDRVKCITSSWVFNGTNVTFPLVDPHGQAVTPQQASYVQASLGGTILEPGVDFTVSLANLTFTLPPQKDQAVFVLVGVPLGGSVTSGPATGGGATYSATPPTSGVTAGSLWATPTSQLFVWDGNLNVWIQLAGGDF